MRDPDPLRWDAQPTVAKVGIIAVGLLLAALILVIVVILAGFAWNAVLWVWS